MARAMAGADMAEDTAEETAWAAGSETRSHRRSPWGAAKRLSDRTPLRTKLIAALLALVIMALAAISVASVIVLRSYLYTQHDDQLRGTYDRVASSLASTPGPVTVQLDYPYPEGSGLILAFQNPGSQLVAANQGPSLPGMGNSHPEQSLPELPTAKNWASANTTTLTTVPAQSGGDTWRVLAQAVSVTNSSTNAKQTSIMVIAVDLGAVGAVVHQLIVVELIVGTAIVIVLAIVGVAVVRANLRPLDDIEMTAGEIAKGHLDHRVPEGDPRTEIGSLGRSLNAMLTQIERAFHAQGRAEQAAHESEERMRRFVADAAHELRTPLTTIRGFAAHYRQRGGASSVRPGAPERNSSFRTDAADSGPSTASPVTGVRQDGMSPEDLDHLVGRVEAEAARMGMLVEDLLTLARLDQQRPLAKAPVDLLTLAVDAVQDARIVSPGRPIDLIVAPGTAFLVNGDEPRLRQVLANLVNNAITHTPAGTPVRVKIARGTLEAQAQPVGRPPASGTAEHDGWGGSASAADALPAPGREVPAIVLDVEDDGPGMSTEQARRVFERFYRADAARNRASGGTGLGLAIVAGLVSAHGGTVSVRTAPGQGADFQVKLPLSPDALAVDDADDELPA
ncbi:MAG: histidine kinase [Actinomycetia bacterium]|nr:histidine kinase [Actinomycetes bacterium]